MLLIMPMSLSPLEIYIRQDANYMVRYKGQIRNSCTQWLSC